MAGRPVKFCSIAIAFFRDLARHTDLLPAFDLLATSSLQRRMAAISQLHEAAGYISPKRSLAVRELLKGVLREKGRKPLQEKKPLRLPELVEVIRSLTLIVVGGASSIKRYESVGPGSLVRTHSRQGKM